MRTEGPNPASVLLDGPLAGCFSDEFTSQLQNVAREDGVNLQTIAPADLSASAKASSLPMQRLQVTILKFVQWLEKYGETSYDFQSFYASGFGQWANATYYKRPKLGILAVAPMVFSEAFVPSARSIFWKRQRFPIADAHYAMGFAFLAKLTKKECYYVKASHFLEVLTNTRCTDYDNYCW